MIKSPFIIEFPKIGNPSIGYISLAEKNNLPFEVKRVYWTYFTPESVKRGGHAHHEVEQILIASAGKIVVETEMPGDNKQSFLLDSPNLGLYLPKFCWHVMKYTHNAVQLCIANLAYTESDYIRDYDEFKKIIL